MNAELFYKNLLQKALLEIKEKKCNAIVFGPLKTTTYEFTEHVKNFLSAQKKASDMGYVIFDQIPYLDIHLKNAPFDFEKKFPIFFGGIIKSGLIQNAFFTTNYKTSQGALYEHDFCVNNKVTIHYL